MDDGAFGGAMPAHSTVENDGLHRPFLKRSTGYLTKFDDDIFQCVGGGVNLVGGIG